MSKQFPPEKDSGIYDQARTLGADHLSFRLGFFSKEHFSLLSPGWAQILGQESFFRALEYCARRMGKGRVSGEMIAGLEPVGDSLRAVDYLVRIGALPLLSIFRHVQGAAMEHFPAPDLQNMLVIFRQVYESCRTRNLPIGMVPNLHLSMLLHPEDTLYLAPDSADAHTYSRWILTMKQVMRPYFLRRMRRQSTSQA